MAFIVSLTGDSGVGKDSSANYIVDYLREKTPLRVGKVNWAAPIKKLTHELYSHLGVRDEDYYDTEEGREARKEIILPLNMTVVDLWLKVGYFFREIYANTWVDGVKRRDDFDIIVCAGTRQPNEMAVSDVTIRVTNSRVPRRPECTMDGLLDGYEVTYWIENELDLNELRNLSWLTAHYIYHRHYKV